MRIKTIVCIAVLGIACVTSAQNVMTLGTFGYTKNVHTAEGLHISGMQFVNSPSNTPQSVYGNGLPQGSKIYAWNGSGYDIVQYNSVFVPPPVGPAFTNVWNSDIELGAGEGYWVQTPASTNAILTGEVPMSDSVTNSIQSGLQILSYPYPVERVVTNLGLTPVLGDKIYVWNGDGYDIVQYNSVFVPPPEGPSFVEKWNNETLKINVGQGFWFQSGADTNWIAVRPYPEI